MAKTSYRKRVINGKEYYFYRLRHENLRKPKDLYGTTVKELDAKIKSVKRDLDYNIKDNREYFDTFFAEWLFNVKFLNVKPSTQSLYEGYYRVHIKESELSNVRIKDICASDIQRYYKSLIKKGVSPNTVRSINKLVAPCIRYAYNNDMIIKDFTGAIELPQENEQTKLNKAEKIKPFTLEEQKKFIAEIKDHELEMLFVTALNSGLRQGELFALTWKDIDFDECYININKTIVYIAEVSEEGREKLERVIQTPKTKNSIRKVSIPTFLVDKLTEYKENQAKNKLKSSKRYEENNLVFCNRYGKYLDSSSVRRKFKKVLIDSNINERKFHDLRHTYATRLFELGETPKMVQMLLGHSNISITLDTYTHVLYNMKEKAASKLDQLYNKMDNE